MLPHLVWDDAASVQTALQQCAGCGHAGFDLSGNLKFSDVRYADQGMDEVAGSVELARLSSSSMDIRLSPLWIYSGPSNHSNPYGEAYSCEARYMVSMHGALVRQTHVADMLDMRGEAGWANPSAAHPWCGYPIGNRLLSAHSSTPAVTTGSS